MTHLTATHRLAWLGDLMIASAPIDEDIDTAVQIALHGECDADTATDWESAVTVVEVILTEDLRDDEGSAVVLHYDGSRGAVGYLPHPYNYAWQII